MEEEKKQDKSKLREWIETIVFALVLALIIRAFIIQPFKIPSESMVQTLKVGDHLFALKFMYGLPVPFTDKHIFEWRDPKRGDIVVFRPPFYPDSGVLKRMIAPPIRVITKPVSLLFGEKFYVDLDPHKDFIKRIIGLPQEEISIKDDTVYIDGEPLDEDYLYLFESFYSLPKEDFGPVVVPENSYFVMGDNRRNSRDSRSWGFLYKDLIKGKAFVLYWPPNRIGLIR